MSEMAPEPGADGGGGMLTKKIMGIPVVVWVGGIALIAYLYLRNRSGSAGSPSTSGGGGSVTTGSTRIDKGAIQVTITQGNPQPHLPHLHHRRTTWHTHPTIPPRKRGAPPPHKNKHKILHTVHRPPSKRHHGNENVPKHKKKPVITN